MEDMDRDRLDIETKFGYSVGYAGSRSQSSIILAKGEWWKKRTLYGVEDCEERVHTNRNDLGKEEILVWCLSVSISLFAY